MQSVTKRRATESESVAKHSVCHLHLLRMRTDPGKAQPTKAPWHKGRTLAQQFQNTANVNIRVQFGRQASLETVGKWAWARTAKRRHMDTETVIPPELCE
jgi:hypothetical protein